MSGGRLQREEKQNEIQGRDEDLLNQSNDEDECVPRQDGQGREEVGRDRC
jgi:hypothetical protein